MGQLFPDDKNAKDVVQVFTSICEDFDQEVRCSADVKDIEILPDGFKVSYEKNGKTVVLTAAKLVIAAGGLPIPKMGATDFALRFAKKIV